tara:strand:+ start:468 stop:1130 length:663 start_codon:yes stop_codon:yes gene_type:complete
MAQTYIFSPSEFAFGFSGCKRCYYDLKINNIKINFGFPTVFSKIDSLQKKFYHNKSSKFLNSDKLPDGVIKTDYTRLQKSEVLYDNKSRAFQLRGKIDAYIDHKNFFSIIDFKVTNINERKSLIYKTQLNSYAIMFEKPDKDYLKLEPVKNLGIFCFEPNNLKVESNPALEMSTQYFEIKRDDDLYFNFITDIIDFLEGDIPNLTNGCSICEIKSQTFPK